MTSNDHSEDKYVAVNVSDIRIFDNVKYIDSDNVVHEAKVVGIMNKGINLKKDGHVFKVNENRIIEILPYTKKEKVT